MGCNTSKDLNEAAKFAHSLHAPTGAPLPAYFGGKADMMVKNTMQMNRIEGFDVVIVCTSTPNQASYWQERLTATLGNIAPKNCKICAVDEDWAAGGAGNGLGTLYAFQKASKLAQDRYGINILAGMHSGKLSVGMYHTAGKGTRLAPIPGAENNNKPGVKLPSVVRTTAGEELPMTILEGVVKQTGVYASSRKGRLSVFWGDQVFIPSALTSYTPKHHADILAQMGPMPSQQQWEEKGYSNYGLIAMGAGGEGAQVEKVSFEQATTLLQGLGKVEEVGPSLGSFSVSHDLLNSLLTEFKGELAAKEVALDSDPHFWMPMTLSHDAYVDIMGTKKMEAAQATAHYKRLQGVKSGLSKKMGTFGAVGVGTEGYWWDYGQVPFYLENNMIMAGDNKEAATMRLFFGVDENAWQADDKAVWNQGSSTSYGPKSHSVVMSSTISDSLSSAVQGSVVVGLRTRQAIMNGCLAVNVTAPSVICGKGCVLYNVVSEEPIELGDNEVLVGMETPDDDQYATDEDQYFLMRSSLDRDGKTDWKVAHSGNPYSYEEVYNLNATADPAKIAKKYNVKHESTRQLLGLK